MMVLTESGRADSSMNRRGKTQRKKQICLLVWYRLSAFNFRIADSERRKGRKVRDEKK